MRAMIVKLLDTEVSNELCVEAVDEFEGDAEGGIAVPVGTIVLEAIVEVIVERIDGIEIALKNVGFGAASISIGVVKALFRCGLVDLVVRCKGARGPVACGWRQSRRHSSPVQRHIPTKHTPTTFLCFDTVLVKRKHGPPLFDRFFCHSKLTSHSEHEKVRLTTS